MKNTNAFSAKTLSLAGLMAALIFVFTFTLKIPSPSGGYVHLGDGFILLSGFFLPPWEAIFSAAIGSTLADVAGGYALYIPATFVIKAIQCAIAYALCKSMKKTAPFSKSLPLRILLASIPAMVWMVFGYFLYEGLLLGWSAGIAALVGNIGQGVAGVVVAAILYYPFRKIIHSALEK